MERTDFVPGTSFKIIQDTELFCYGTDSLLLADFALKNPHCIQKNSLACDLGCGNAIIPLILSAKSNAKKIYGIEAQKKSAELAKKNVKLNSLEEKISILNANLKNLFETENSIQKNTFDAVLANPPYFSDGSGEKNSALELSFSRHQNQDTNEIFIKSASLLLKSQKSFFMINRPCELENLLFLMHKYKLEAKHLKFVYPSPQKNASMVLIHAVKSAKPSLCIEKPLFISEIKNVF